ncbi:MAG: aminomethyl-transferring glycine dehydrogenase subunit GcvPA [Gemmatimonadota bacterium]|jgi:glycine dehydrogenase subunit 1|nr:MAG: aminomethyl-transferring glycine dehydrogenase subunit GcvPA [Gemmatimonadota bacterium]
MSFLTHSEADRRQMLEAIGASGIRDLYADIPQSLILEEPLSLPEALSEWEATRLVSELAARNRDLVCFAGAGIYDHHVPAAADHILRRSEFYTAYTPYQPEVSQGTLQSIYEFQTMVCELTGLDVANASIYDGATATAEAVLMALSVTRRQEVILAGHLHPHYSQVLKTYTQGLSTSVRTLPPGAGGTVEATDLPITDATACVVVQNPNFLGLIEELGPIVERAHSEGALVICSVADPVSLALIRSPGDQGVDVVAGEGQPFGNTPNFGGPVVGLFAAREKYIRKMPGRIVGATEDAEGRRGYVLTLQTREQQIRREKATSNICTNQGLNALAATLHLALIGREGLRQVAETSVQNAHYAASRIRELEGFELLHPGTPFVREFAVRTEEDPRSILGRAIERGVLAGVRLGRFPDLGTPDGLLLAFTEKRTRAEIDLLVDTLAGG